MKRKTGSILLLYFGHAVDIFAQYLFQNSSSLPRNRCRQQRHGGFFNIHFLECFVFVIQLPISGKEILHPAISGWPQCLAEHWQFKRNQNLDAVSRWSISIALIYGATGKRHLAMCQLLINIYFVEIVDLPRRSFESIDSAHFEMS